MGSGRDPNPRPTAGSRRPRGPHPDPLEARGVVAPGEAGAPDPGTGRGRQPVLLDDGIDGEDRPRGVPDAEAADAARAPGEGDVALEQELREGPRRRGGGAGAGVYLLMIH